MDLLSRLWVFVTPFLWLVKVKERRIFRQIDTLFLNTGLPLRQK